MVFVLLCQYFTFVDKPPMTHIHSVQHLWQHSTEMMQRPVQVYLIDIPYYPGTIRPKVVQNQNYSVCFEMRQVTIDIKNQLKNEQ